MIIGSAWKRDSYSRFTIDLFQFYFLIAFISVIQEQHQLTNRNPFTLPLALLTCMVIAPAVLLFCFKGSSCYIVSSFNPKVSFCFWFNGVAWLTWGSLLWLHSPGWPWTDSLSPFAVLNPRGVRFLPAKVSCPTIPRSGYMLGIRQQILAWVSRTLVRQGT